MVFAKKYRPVWVVLAIVLLLGVIGWLFLMPAKSTTLIQEALTESSPPASVYDYTYKGCWNGTDTNGANPALPMHLTGVTDLSGCVTQGRSNQYKTIGWMKNSSTSEMECWAGNNNTTYLVNDYKVNGAVTDTSTCDVVNPGPNNMMVYSALNETVTTPIDGYRYGGCWKDNDSNPSLSTRLGPTESGPLTLENCVAYGKNGNFNSVAYKANGTCYGGNQGSGGVDYKNAGGEIPNNDPRCDVGGPGPDTSIIYTTYGATPQAPTISGYDYKGCWKDGSPSFTSSLIGNGYTLDQCVNAAKTGGPRGIKYDMVSFQDQNVCRAGTQGAGSDYTTYGQISDNFNPSCNPYYPGTNVGVVYSTSNSPVDNHDYDQELIDKIQDRIGGGGGGGGGTGSAPTSIGNYTFRGYWNESVDRTVPNYLGVFSLDECVAQATAKSYNTVSFQNKNQCWAGTDSNYKKYGIPTNQSLNDPYTTVAEIYATGNQPSAHNYCGAHREGVDTMTDQTSTQNVPQPPYTIPQTTTVSFDPIPKTNTIITYSQLPIETSATATKAASATDTSTSLGATDNSDASELKDVSTMNQKDKSTLHKTWLPNTPFVYENSNDEETNPAASASVAAAAAKKKIKDSSSSSSFASSGSVFPNTDIINNQYTSASPNTTNDTVLEFFTTATKVPDKISKNNYWRIKENIESMSPPQEETTPGAFVPKTMIVPPVCPSIPPVIIKTDCSVCNKSAKDKNTSSSSSGQAEMKQQMTNTFTNENSPNSNPYSTSSSAFDSTQLQGQAPSCKNRSYDNIPQPYLPSFSGFGM